MAVQPVLIAGAWQTPATPLGTFTAENPATKSPLPDPYPVSDLETVERALQAGQAAATELRAFPPEALAGFLERFADTIETRAAELVELAHLETALPVAPRLRDVELPRTINQLRQAAAAARARSWCHATIDTASNIRSLFEPLGGAVVVFGPNNFPFAFNSAAGGDFAAAIAAGNPVIAKANPGHPGTTRIFAEAAFEAVQASGLPRATVQLIYRVPAEVGLTLVSHPLVAATGFTGSKSAGLRLKEAADRAGKPIYLEMSSVNPIFVLPGALRERLMAIADELFGSCALGAGQFCTSPGLTVIERDDQGDAFIDALKTRFAGSQPGILLGASGPQGINEAIQLMRQHGADVLAGGQESDQAGYAFANTLLRVTGELFLENPHVLQTEAFGTVNLVVVARNRDQMIAIANRLEGNLTGCVYSHTAGEDDEYYNQLAPVLRQKVGRLLNDKMPTGVAVVPSMNHGGPYPATGHPGFTAVGIPASLLRFGALHCYDNVRAHRLPTALRNANPTGAMWRLIDGIWTQQDIEG